jgi:hypothetical protein
MYTMIYTVTIYILCTEEQYMVHTILYMVNMEFQMSWGSSVTVTIESGEGEFYYIIGSRRRSAPPTGVLLLSLTVVGPLLGSC